MKKQTKALSLAMAILMMGSTFISCDQPDGPGGDYVATVKIGYSTCGYGDEYIEKWAEAYNIAHPDEKIYFDIDNNADDINSRLQTNSELSDIFISLATFWQTWAKNGWLEPLDDIYTMKNVKGEVYADRLLDDYANTGIVDGQHYVVPHSGPGAAAMGYSHKLFTEMGWEVPETMDDLFALVESINALPCNNDANKSNDIAPFAWGGQAITYWDPFIYSIWASVDGKEAMDNFWAAGSAEIYKNRPGLEKALNVFRELICTGEGVPKNSLSGAMGKNHLLSQNDFVQGRAAILINVSGAYNETELIRPDDFDLRAFAYPTVSEAEKDENGNPIHYSMVTNDMYDFMCIPKNIPEENKVYAKKFLVWLSTTEANEIFLQYARNRAPFECDYANVEMNEFYKSQLAVNENTKFIVAMTDSPLVQMNTIKVFPATGSPYAQMILNNVKPSVILKENYEYAVSQWNNWQADVGIK